MNTKLLIFCFVFLLFACKNEQKQSTLHKSKQKIVPEYMLYNRKDALETLIKYKDKKYFLYNSCFDDRNTSNKDTLGALVYINQKHEPNISIVSFCYDSLFIFTKSKASKIWTFSNAEEYGFSYFDIKLVDMNGDNFDDIYLHRIDGSGGIPYHFVATYNPKNSNFVYKSYYSDLSNPYFNTKTKLVETIYDVKQSKKERFKIQSDTLVFIDAVEYLPYGRYSQFDKELDSSKVFKRKCGYEFVDKNDNFIDCRDYSTIIFFKNINGKKTIQKAWQEKNIKAKKIFHQSLFSEKGRHFNDH